MRKRSAKIIHGGLYLVSRQHLVSLLIVKSDFTTRTTPFQSWSCWKVISSALQAETLMQPHHWNQGTRVWMCHSNPFNILPKCKGWRTHKHRLRLEGYAYHSMFRNQKDVTKWPIGHSLVNESFSLILDLMVSDHI